MANPNSSAIATVDQITGNVSVESRSRLTGTLTVSFKNGVDGSTDDIISGLQERGFSVSKTVEYDDGSEYIKELTFTSGC